MKVSKQGVDLICTFEGFEENAYPDPATGNVPWTIGYGTTVYSTGKPVKKGDRITEEQAEYEITWWLDNKVIPYIESLVTVPLTQGQIDGLASFIYNVGPTNFKNSTLLKKLNAKDYLGAGNQFPRWNRANGKVMNGLTRRREAEKAVFLQ